MNDRKPYQRGSVPGGIFGVVFSVVFIALAIGMTGAFGLFGLLFAAFGVFFLVVSINQIRNGRKSDEVARKGKEATALVKGKRRQYHSSHHSGRILGHYTYYVLYEYTDESGVLRECEEALSAREYDEVIEGGVIPVLVYRERAIFDKDKYYRREEKKR